MCPLSHRHQANAGYIGTYNQGEGEEGDIERLINLGNTIKQTALCGLGQTAPNPVLTTIKYFRDEYEAHINTRNVPPRYVPHFLLLPVRMPVPPEWKCLYIDAIRRGDYANAVRIIREDNPFPAVCGRGALTHVNPNVSGTDR